MKKTTSTTKDILRVYWQASRPYRTLFFSTIGAIGFGTILSLIIPLYYKQFFDQITQLAPSETSVGSLSKIILMILILNAVNWFAYRVGTVLNTYYQASVIRDLKNQSLKYLLGHSYAFFANSFGGALVQRVNRFAKAFERLADRLIWDLLVLIIRVIGVTVTLWYFNHLIAAAVVVWTSLYMLMHFGLSIYKLRYDIARSAQDSQVTATLADIITNHTTIQSFTGEEAENNRFQKETTKFFHLQVTAWNIANIIEAIQAFFMFLIEFFLFYEGIRLWSQGLITIGTFVLMQSYLLTLMSRLWDFGRVIRDIYESTAEAREMVDILQTPHQVTDAKDATKLQVIQGAIVLDRLSFRYHQKRNVLEKIRLSIRGGEKIALVGPSGAGKSTIVKLLLRLYDPTSGRILIDRQPTQRVTQQSLREAIGFVSQDPLLFHQTIKENIRYGRRDATDEEVYEAACLAHCDEFIQELPTGYDTYVGERGIKLSGGERQRVAIARAMLKNAPILILDEATSSLDSHSESLIQDALQKLMAGRTTIVIAHRLSTIRLMDRILVMKNGAIIEEGSHEQLLRKKAGLYRKLWELQAGGFLVDEK